MAGAKTTTAGPTSASAIRIRENQRRSRARRKEYVETMERKLHEYERRGVDASLEMQQAARTVAVENARLRIMLAQMGAAAADVDAFLQAFQDRDAAQTLSSVRLLQGAPPAAGAESTSAGARSHGCCDDFARYHGDACCEAGGHAGPGAAELPPPRLDRPRPPVLSLSVPPSAQAWAAFDKLDVLAAASIQQGCCGDGDGRFATLPALSTARAESPSTVEPSPGAATPSSQGAGGLGSLLSMSCDAAAQIIADMQDCAADRTLAKQEPGCGGRDGCLADGHANNTLFFQDLDRHGQFR